MSSTNRILRPIQRFTIRKVDSSVVLFLATIVALIVANSPLRDLYHSLLAMPINLNILGLDIFQYHGEPMSFLVFANDVLMVFFFFVVGLDIKQQLLVGELSSVKKAMMHSFTPRLSPMCSSRKIDYDASARAEQIRR